MDPFRTQFHDFHQKDILDLVLDLVQILELVQDLVPDLNQALDQDQVQDTVCVFGKNDGIGSEIDSIWFDRYWLIL